MRLLCATLRKLQGKDFDEIPRVKKIILIAPSEKDTLDSECYSTGAKKRATVRGKYVKYRKTGKLEVPCPDYLG